MENRFGVKDLFLFVLLTVLILTVFLAMKQYDRQWSEIQAMRQTLTEQTSDLAAIRRQLSEGIAVQSRAGPTTSPTTKGDPFAHVKAAKHRPDFALGDWFVDNFGTKVPTLTPLVSSDLYGTIVQNRILESLIYRDPYTLDNFPLLARDWQMKDNSPQWKQAVADLKRRIDHDPEAVAAENGVPAELKAVLLKLKPGQSAQVPHELLILHGGLPSALDITFQLRPGVSFSDGVPMTADDVVFTFDWIMNPQVNAPRERAFYQKIRSVEKTGELEVVFKFRDAYFESLELAGGISVMPKHFYSRFTPEQFNEAPGLLLGTGPYRLKDPQSWRPGDQIELYRNERYWGEPGTFDRLVWYQVENEAASMTLFRNGEVDFFGATPEQYRVLKQDQQLLKRVQVFEYESPLSGYTYIAWNEKRHGQPTRFADKRVRQAMTMLTDRQRMIDELFLGYAKIADGPFSRLSKQADPNIKPWSYSPKRARELLKEAGYEDRNGDGVLESPTGEPFAFKLSYPSGSELYERLVLFLKDTYARAGVSLVPDPQDWPIIVNKLNQRDFDAISLAWTGGVETDIYQMFHSDEIKDQGDNFMSYANPELDRLIDQARITLDEKQRMPLWQAAQGILHEDQPYTFLTTRMSLAFMDGRIKNVERSRLGLNYVQRDVMPIPWYVPRNLQKWSK